MSRKKALIILGLILLVAGFLRIIRLDMHDVITDETFYGYRSIGLIDSLNSPYQPTPYETFTTVPLWAKISFHDHPPLGFWIQHIFFRVLGVNLWAMRLPFAIAGILSVFLIYLIGKRMFESERVGLLAAGFLAICNYHVWISRIGLQESLVIVFMLFAFWLFLKALSDKKYFYWMAAATSLAVLMKYTAGVLLPIFFIYLLWKRRDLLTRAHMLLAAGIFIVITSPIWIYNIGLSSMTGHFDFQISFFLGQNVPEWAIRPGREVGGFGTRVVNFFVRFWNYGGAIFCAMVVSALVFLVAKFRKTSQGRLLLVTLAILTVAVLVIGPQERFLTMLVPFFAICIGAAVNWLFSLGRWKLVLLPVVAVFFLGETVYAVNSNLLVVPKGREDLTISELRRESNAWGYNQLDEYLTSVTAGKYPVGTFPMRFPFAQKLHQQRLAEDLSSGKEPARILFVGDSGMEGPASLWYLTRRIVYDRWPFINEGGFMQALAQDPEFFSKQGFERVIFIRVDPSEIRPDQPSAAAAELEQDFLKSGVQPKVINTPAGDPAFRIYDTNLDKLKISSN